MQVSRKEKTDACPSAIEERKTSSQSRISFDPRDVELVCPAGYQGLAGV